MPYFVRRLYHSEQLGPFPDFAAVRAYIAAQMAADPYWTYDPPGCGEWERYPECLPLATWLNPADEAP